MPEFRSTDNRPIEQRVAELEAEVTRLKTMIERHSAWIGERDTEIESSAAAFVALRRSPV